MIELTTARRAERIRADFMASSGFVNRGTLAIWRTLDVYCRCGHLAWLTHLNTFRIGTHVLHVVQVLAVVGRWSWLAHVLLVRCKHTKSIRARERGKILLFWCEMRGI